MLSLVNSRVMQDFPKLKIIVAHGGRFDTFTRSNGGRRIMC